MENGIDVANLTPALKEVYGKAINNTFNKTQFLAKHIATDTEGIQSDGVSGGRYKVQVLKLDDNPSAGSRGEDELLPEGGKGVYARTLIDLTTLAANTKISGLAEAQSDSPEKAVQNKAISNAVKESTFAATRDFNRKLWGNKHGGLFTVTAVTGTGPYTVEFNNDQARLNKWVSRGELVQFGTVTSGVASVVAADVYQVTSVNKSAGTFVVAAYPAGTTPAAPDVADYVFAQGSVNNALVGIDQAIGDTTSVFQTLDPANYGDDWKPIRTNASAASISVDGLDEHLEKLETTSGANYLDGEDVLILTDRGQARNLYNSIDDNIRFNDSKNVAPKGINYGTLTLPTGHTVMNHYEVTPNKAIFINKKDVSLISAKGGYSFLHGDEFKNYERKDSKEIILIRYCQLGWLKRNSHGEIYNLAD